MNELISELRAHLETFPGHRFVPPSMFERWITRLVEIINAHDEQSSH